MSNIIPQLLGIVPLKHGIILVELFKQQTMYNLQKACEIIKDSYFTHDSITTEQIKKELTNYLDELVEEINNDPLYFFRENHYLWRKLDKVAQGVSRPSRV